VLKKIIQTISQFIKDDFRWTPYLFSLLFILLALYINYFSSFREGNFSLEEKFTRQYHSTKLLYFWYLPFYSIPYFLVLLVKLFSENQIGILKKRLFWIKISFIFFLLCLDGGFYFNAQWLKPLPFNEKYTLFEFINAGHSFFTVFIPIATFYFIFNRQQHPLLYGITFKNISLKPYFLILLFISPLIYLASLSDDFLAQYPSYNMVFLKGIYGVSQTLIEILYEIEYLLDFINLELLMRGLMVVGMIHILGRNAILPTTIVYVLLHFEKPLAEAIGSLFGGYILSILAYKNKSIWGGIILHIGLAALMELFAFLQIK
jgi:hypothetical protein